MRQEKIPYALATYIVGYADESEIRILSNMRTLSDAKPKHHYELVSYRDIGITQSVILISRQNDTIGAEFGESIIAHGSVAVISNIIFPSNNGSVFAQPRISSALETNSLRFLPLLKRLNTE